MKKIYTSLIMTAVILLLYLIPMDVHAQTQTSVYLPSQAIQVNGTSIESGQYYKSNSSGEIRQCYEETPSTEYLYYDAATGVLKLNNFDYSYSEQSNGPQLIIIDSQKVTEGTVYQLTIELTGTNKLTVYKDSDNTALDLGNVDCTITGTGSLTVSGKKAGDNLHPYSLAVFHSLYVKDSVELEFTSESVSDEMPMISSAGNITLAGNAKLTANGKNSIYSGNTITISDNSHVKIPDTENTTAITGEQGVIINGGTIEIENTQGGIHSTQGKISITGGTVTITSGDAALAAYADISITGGTVKAVSSARRGIHSYNGIIIISGNADVTAKGGIDVGSCSAIQGIAVTVSGGKVTAIGGTGYGAYGILGENKITISGGTVNVKSTAESALYSSGSVNITGGTTALSEVNTFDGNLIINGDAVFYGNSISGNSTLTKGVVYTGTAVSIDDDGTLGLTGGSGIVYGNPDVASDAYVKPTGSILETALDDCVTITPQDTVYTGSKYVPTLRVIINKKALGGQTELTKGVDYTLAEIDNEDYVNAGSPKMKIIAVSGSGYTGFKDFTFRITAKAGLTWDTSGLTVSKYEDGTTSPAEVTGVLKVTGIEGVELAYDDITASAFPDSAAGKYTVTLTLKNPQLNNANYPLPAESITVTAEIHHLLKHVAAADATTEKDGNIEHWLCESCGKYFADSAGQSVLSYSDIIIKRLQESETSESPEAPGSTITNPDTGDDGYIILWMAVLALSITMPAAVCFKKRNASVK